jgi:hypothetical protein
MPHYPLDEVFEAGIPAELEQAWSEWSAGR